MGLSIYREQVSIQADGLNWEGTLCLPEGPIGSVLFAAEIGSENTSSEYVASMLRNAHLATFCLNASAHMKEKKEIGVRVLTRLLGAACDWLRQYRATVDLPIGMFCIGTGSAAALELAAMRGNDVAMIVVRGGRPDLAGHGALGKINAPTLVIAGGLDEGGAELNRSVYAALRCKKRYEVIPGATQNFDEPGSPEVVARLARGWFLQHANAARL